jgi:hypothetical protein
MSAPYLLLGLLVLPLWIAAGLADYFCHRAAQISKNSGTLESVFHLIQFSLVGLPVTIGLFFRSNAGFFLLCALCILLHHGAAYIDVRYANGTRKVTPLEQMVHSFLELLPITAFLLLATAEWSQFLAAVYGVEEAPRFSFELRLMSAPYIAAILSAAFFLNFIPYLEEFVRCVRDARRN